MRHQQLIVLPLIIHMLILVGVALPFNLAGRQYSSNIRSFTDSLRENNHNFDPFARQDGFKDSDIYRGVFSALTGAKPIFAFALTAFLPPNSPEYNLMVEEFAKVCIFSLL